MRILEYSKTKRTRLFLQDLLICRFKNGQNTIKIRCNSSSFSFSIISLFSTIPTRYLARQLDFLHHLRITRPRNKTFPGGNHIAPLCCSSCMFSYLCKKCEWEPGSALPVGRRRPAEPSDAASSSSSVPPWRRWGWGGGTLRSARPPGTRGSQTSPWSGRLPGRWGEPASSIVTWGGGRD